MPKWRIRVPLVRVSSARITDTDFRISMARGAISSRFPTGVGTTYSLPVVSSIILEQSGYRVDKILGGTATQVYAVAVGEYGPYLVERTGVSESAEGIGHQ